ncbi:MAG: TonB-dependent receptor plug domain-containing protein [Pseudomonadota bacterium]
MSKQFVLPDDGVRFQSGRTKPAAWYGLLFRCGAIALAISLVLNPAGAAATDDSPEAITTSDLAYLTLEELSNIEITSVSKRSELLSDAPAAIYVITQEDIRRSGATSIPEILRLAPNLRVARVDADQYAITARGFNSTTANKLLVLIDGRSVYTPLYSGVFWDAQDMLLKNNDRIRGLRKFPQILRRG